MIYVSIAAILMIFEFLKSLSYKTEQLLIIEAIMNINLFLQRRLIQLNIMDNLILKANFSKSMKQLLNIIVIIMVQNIFKV